MSINNTLEEKLCTCLDACLGTTLQEIWQAFSSALHNRIDQESELIFLKVMKC